MKMNENVNFYSASEAKFSLAWLSMVAVSVRLDVCCAR